jgi:hypothetical protein
MSPAGSGRGQFRGALGARVDRGGPAAHQDDAPGGHASGLTGRNAQSVPRATVCTCLLPWLLPVGLLGAVVLISVSGVFGFILAGIWGWLAFPYLAMFISARARAGGNGDAFRDGETDYWRTKLM